MKSLLFTLVLFSFPAFLSAESADSIQIITLKDASVIRAKVTEDAGGFFLIKSPALGEIKIRTSDIASIKQANPQSAILPKTQSSPAADASPSGAAGAADLQSDLSSKVQNFLSSGSGMAAVTQLSQNPNVKAVLADPNLVKAIQSGDTAALRESPAVKQLMDNPQTKSLIKSLIGPATKNPAQ